MRFLVIADEPSEYLWSDRVREALKDTDLIISCGDLPKDYLEYLVTFAHAPLYYIHGNHDGNYEENPPEGCECIDGKLVKYKGVRIVGLGGSFRYNRGSTFQYTQREMKKRVNKLIPRILINKGFDILVTHAGAEGIGDGDDRAHRGFTVFNRLIDKWKPKYFIHGHSHMNYSMHQKRVDHHGDTIVINAYEKYEIEVNR